VGVALVQQVAAHDEVEQALDRLTRRSRGFAGQGLGGAPVAVAVRLTFLKVMLWKAYPVLGYQSLNWMPAFGQLSKSRLEKSMHCTFALLVCRSIPPVGLP